MSVKFSKDHEWIQIDGDVATIGVTDYAQNALGDVVFVELPEPGKRLTPGDEACVVESVKAASEVYAPITGTIEEVNAALEETPDLVNSDPEGAGWFFKMTIGNSSELNDLMDEAAYKAFTAGLE